MTSDLIPFEIETRRVVQLLAKQIYQSPLALLRENAQNAFDAVQQRLHRDATFEPIIEISLTPDRVTISDNGIGMTPNDLQRHYWTAGSSSKNNEDARAAGVVGTFGIGAMANFGIAEQLVVETESALTGERTLCRAERGRLDLKRDCIERKFLTSTGNAGTSITAHVGDGEEIDVQIARNYISEFVSLVNVPVRVNGTVVSQKSPDDLIPKVPESWKQCEKRRSIGPRMSADVVVVVSNNADIWICLTEIMWDSTALAGKLVLRTGHSNLRTFRNGFGLATASVGSSYQFGGIADLAILEPTAGREAITVEGLQLLQLMMVEVDRFISELLANHDECDSSTSFMQWVLSHRRYDLCGRLRMTVHPGERIALQEVAQRSQGRAMPLYEGSDQGVIKAYASDDTPLLVLARTNPRRKCEREFLKGSARISLIADAPVVKNKRTYGELSLAESALAYRVRTILETDYFLKCSVGYGDISHNLPVFANRSAGIVDVVLNPGGQSVKLLLGIYDTEYTAFSSMAKDFVRNTIFSRVADFVPSSTRQGAESFLRAIRKTPEPFEYADDDLGSLPSIWKDYDDGQITLEQAVARSTAAVRSSVQVVDAAVSAQEVVPDVIENEQALTEDSGHLQSLGPWPGISRMEISSTHKLLVIEKTQPALRGYRCFLAITDKAREQMGEFFLQPHLTSVVWGGQKTLFIFMHHSGEFGLYYDLQTRDVVDAPAGGGTYPTCSIVIRDKIFIPVPDDIRASFIPAPGERKRFEVRADILRAGTG